MAVPDLNKPLIPKFDVSIAGNSLTVDTRVRLADIAVDDSVELPSMFTFSLTGSDEQGNKGNWVDNEDMFSVGKAVEIKMGYGAEIDSLIKGEITALEPEFSRDRLPALTVRGYDRRHRLQRGRKTRTFVQQKDSEIASQIAGEAGLSADATDTGVTHDYVVQANQSDLDFLNERARKIEYEAVVDDSKLIFRPVPNDQSAVLTMKLADYLLEFNPRLSSSQQMTEISVRGWNPKEKKEFVGSSKAGDEASMGGGTSGPKMAESAFGAAVGLISAWPVMSQEEADKIAKALLNRAALSLVVGDGVCLGITDVRAGKVIKIDGEGVSKLFRGQYYVTSATHRYNPDEGYRTHFSVRRNASA